MQSTISEKIITVNLKDKQEDMPIKVYSRWLSLIEAIELVCNKAKQMKIDTHSNLDWIKPLAFQKYIEERYESMIDEIEHFESNPELIKENAIDLELCNTLQEPASK
ncbi:MAG: hypothetical protein EBU90_06690 [Proteobacteria bacterium]|nr:hypothetical protein [Pseudomonadota bacterium]NBP14995.1 hypothetical protein [bacterium]